MTMNLRGKLAIAGAVAAAATVLTIPPSSAAASGGSFNWSATITTGIKSRTWTTDKAGSITISAYFPCWNPEVSTYEVTLIREKFGSDQRYKTVKYPCNTTHQYTWTGSLPADQYHFNLTKATDGIKVSGHGSVTYP